MEFSIEEKRFFDIHIQYGKKDGDGYSIPIVARSKEDAIAQAKANNLFEYEDDVKDIDYVNELSQEEFEAMTK